MTEPEKESPLPVSLIHEFVAVTESADSGSGFQIVLMTGGFVVSGKMISTREYFELLTKSILKDLTDLPEMAKAVTDAFGSLRDRSVEYIESGDVPHVVHLRDARVLSPLDALKLSPPGLWRASIRHISGYTLGEPAPGK
jgi:hypothetical protein